MRILNQEELVAWDLRWPKGEPGPWRLSAALIDEALSSRPTAIGVYWIGSCDGSHASFQARYCGKAVDQPLRSRLMQHASGRGNYYVAHHLNDKKLSKSDPLWFRFVEFPTREMAEFVEGTMISAFREDFKWNGRNEFIQQWALENASAR